LINPVAWQISRQDLAEDAAFLFPGALSHKASIMLMTALLMINPLPYKISRQSDSMEIFLCRMNMMR
ncbi:MAG: hypothetical protein PHD34_08915, partial [Methanothrix soehngenii]|nr:hypothetical protein [Methanothrix soehngenii]